MCVPGCELLSKEKKIEGKINSISCWNVVTALIFPSIISATASPSESACGHDIFHIKFELDPLKALCIVGKESSVTANIFCSSEILNR